MPEGRGHSLDLESTYLIDFHRHFPDCRQRDPNPYEPFGFHSPVSSHRGIRPDSILDSNIPVSSLSYWT